MVHHNFFFSVTSSSCMVSACTIIVCWMKNMMEHADLVRNHLYYYWTISFYFLRQRTLKCICFIAPPQCFSAVLYQALLSHPCYRLPNLLKLLIHLSFYLLWLSLFTLWYPPLFLSILFSLLDCKPFEMRDLILLSMIRGQLHWIRRGGREPVLTLLKLKVSFFIHEMLISSFWILHLRGCWWNSLATLWTATTVHLNVLNEKSVVAVDVCFPCST